VTDSVDQDILDAPTPPDTSSLLRECAKACEAVMNSDTDPAIMRVALDALTRHATPRRALVSGDWWSTGVAAEHHAGSKARHHLEHVIPVRVLVDRMIAGDEALAVLQIAVVARVTEAEHEQLGTMLQTHKDLYERMRHRKTPLSELQRLGAQRYLDSGVRLVREP
jgi:hypothetical protein